MSHPLTSSYLPGRLELSCGPAVLRYPNDDELFELAALVAGGGLDDEASRYGLGSWADDERDVVAGHVVESCRSAPTHRHGWRVPFVVFANGHPVGVQQVSSVGPGAGDMSAGGQVKRVQSGSWILNTARSNGYGYWARAAVVSLAWALGAQVAESTWMSANTASGRISSRLGYATTATRIRWSVTAGAAHVSITATVTPATFRCEHPTLIGGLDDTVVGWFAARVASADGTAGGTIGL